MDSDIELINTEAQNLVRELGLPEGFYDGLLKEDDWSFVVKLHALVEAAVTHLLVNYLGQAGLEELFSLVELSDARKGKLAFVKALGIFEKEERRFIRSLSELRNLLVHDVSNVWFQFGKYVSGLDDKKRKGFVESFGFTHAKVQIFKNKEISLDEFALMNPKILIWQTGLHVMGLVNLLADTAKSEHRYGESLKEWHERLRAARVFPMLSLADLASRGMKDIVE